MGDKDRAMKFTRSAFEERSDYMIYLRTDPWAEEMRGDPRFQEILRLVAQGGIERKFLPRLDKRVSGKR